MGSPFSPRTPTTRLVENCRVIPLINCAVCTSWGRGGRQRFMPSGAYVKIRRPKKGELSRLRFTAYLGNRIFPRGGGGMLHAECRMRNCGKNLYMRLPPFVHLGKKGQKSRKNICGYPHSLPLYPPFEQVYKTANNPTHVRVE